MQRAPHLNSMPQLIRTVSIGGLSKTALLDRMRVAGIKVNAVGLELFGDESFRTQQVPSIIKVVQTTVGELGLPHGGELAKIIDAAEAQGLALCPLELGPHLRLALPDQEEGAVGFEATEHKAPPRSITVVSHRPREDEDEYRGFYLRRIEGTLWLRGYKSWSGHIWHAQDMLAFTSARNAA